MTFGASRMFVLLVVAVLCGASQSRAVVHRIGGDAGWGLHVNYTDWVRNVTFRVGDTIVFNYNPKIHFVTQVPYMDYLNCFMLEPFAIYRSGNDSVTLDTPGTMYFMCPWPNYCFNGVKIEVNVHDQDYSGSAPAPAPTPTHTMTPIIISGNYSGSDKASPKVLAPSEEGHGAPSKSGAPMVRCWYDVVLLVLGVTIGMVFW